MMVLGVQATDRAVERYRRISYRILRFTSDGVPHIMTFFSPWSMSVTRICWESCRLFSGMA